MGRLSKWRAQQAVNLPSNDCAGSTPALPTNLYYEKIMRVAPGCYFEQEEEEPIDPIRGRKTSANIKEPTYRRRSTLEDIPDNYSERIMRMNGTARSVPEREVRTPEGFAVSIAYNKSGYMLIPKEDLKN